MSGVYKRTKKIKGLISRSLRRFYSINPMTPEQRLARSSGRGTANHKWSRLQMKCRNCGVRKWIKRCHVGRARYCSRKCQNEWQSNHQTNETRKKLSEAASRRNHNPDDRFGDGHGSHFTKHGVMFHSFYELRFFESMQRMGIRCERNYDRFSYVWEGRHHWYTPDFKMYYPGTGSFEYIEIKGWPRPRDVEKLKAVKAAGKEIQMFTDLGLSTLEIEVSKR